MSDAEDASNDAHSMRSGSEQERPAAPQRRRLRPSHRVVTSCGTKNRRTRSTSSGSTCSSRSRSTSSGSTCSRGSDSTRSSRSRSTGSGSTRSSRSRSTSSGSTRSSGTSSSHSTSSSRSSSSSQSSSTASRRSRRRGTGGHSARRRTGSHGRRARGATSDGALSDDTHAHVPRRAAAPVPSARAASVSTVSTAASAAAASASNAADNSMSRALAASTASAHARSAPPAEDGLDGADMELDEAQEVGLEDWTMQDVVTELLRRHINQTVALGGLPKSAVDARLDALVAYELTPADVLRRVAEVTADEVAFRTAVPSEQSTRMGGYGLSVPRILRRVQGALVDTITAATACIEHGAPPHEEDAVAHARTAPRTQPPGPSASPPTAAAPVRTRADIANSLLAQRHTGAA